MHSDASSGSYVLANDSVLANDLAHALFPKTVNWPAPAL
ncbi:MAG: hypothetical protein JWM16_4637 [Verrucomicrobiales bacterium]|nr:hypothetical protein [Verrucomicrobiales bacterium]